MFQKGLFIDEPKVNLEMRRAGIMEPTIWVSSTGKLYTKSMTIDVTTKKGTSGTIYNALSPYGICEHLEELILTGYFNYTANGDAIAQDNFTSDKFPKLRRLIISPTRCLYQNNTESYPYGQLAAGHYGFTNTNLELLVLGTPNLVPYKSGGYFRKDAITGKSGRTGSSNGLTIVIYTDTYYDDSAGQWFPFYRGKTDYCADTIVHQYDYLTGEELFPTPE